MLGGEGRAGGLNIALNPPTVILMAGLAGLNRQTTAGKLALRLAKERKKVLLVSLDTRRPAAMEQLAMLATQAGRRRAADPSSASRPDIARRAVGRPAAAG